MPRPFYNLTSRLTIYPARDSAVFVENSDLEHGKVNGLICCVPRFVII